MVAAQVLSMVRVCEAPFSDLVMVLCNLFILFCVLFCDWRHTAKKDLLFWQLYFHQSCNC